MNRDEAHAATVLILSDMPRGYKFTDAADDILDAIWQAGLTSRFVEGYEIGLVVGKKDSLLQLRAVIRKALSELDRDDELAEDCGICHDKMPSGDAFVDAYFDPNLVSDA